MTTTSSRTRTAGAVLVLAATLTACSSGGEPSQAGGATGAMAAPGAETSQQTTAQAAAAKAQQLTSSAGRPVARPAVQAQAVIRTGQVLLRSRHVDRVRGDVERLLRAVRGYVESEQTQHDRRGEAVSSTLVLRVPASAFGGTLAGIERLARVVSSDQSSRDVTTEVIDVDQRVQTLRNSLERLHRFQRRATDVTDLLRYENDITARQGELQSLTARQTYLLGQTSMSTITVQLDRPVRVGPPPGGRHDTGFLAGLTRGWTALLGVLVAGSTALGAVVPFAVVVLVLGVPVWLLVRRRRVVGAAAPAPAGPSDVQ